MDTFSMEIIKGFFIFLIVFTGGLLVSYYYQQKKSSKKIPTASNQGVILRAVLPLEFSFHREKSSRVSLLEWLGVKKEFTIGFGQGSFDRSVYISSDTPRIVNILKQRKDLCLIIEQLLDEEKQVSFIDFSDNALQVKIKGSKSTFTKNAEYIRENYGEKLQILVKGFEEGFKIVPSSHHDAEDRLNSRKLKLLQKLYGCALIAAGVQLFYTTLINTSDYIPTNSYNFKQMLLLTVVLFFIFFIASVWWGGGTRRTNRIVFYNFALGIALSGLLTFNTYNALNVLLDNSEAVIYEVDYHTEARRGSKSTSYYMYVVNAENTSKNELTLPPYGGLHKNKVIRIGSSSYRRLPNPGKTELTVRSGFFKQPYIEHI